MTLGLLLYFSALWFPHCKLGVTIEATLLGWWGENEVTHLLLL